MHSWNTFGVGTNHKQTRTHKIHHGSDLGETTTFPPYSIIRACHEAYTQMSFCPKIPKLRVPEFSKLGFLRLWRFITSCEDLRLK